MKLTAVSAAALSAALIGCARRPDAVRIAVAAPLTGPLSAQGQGLGRAVELAVEQAAAAGRLPYKVEVVGYDDHGNPQDAVRAAERIVDDPTIAAVVGHYSSDCAIPAAKVYARAGLAMISPSATNPALTAQQLSPDWTSSRSIFRVVPSDDLQGAFAASYMYRTLGRRKVAVFEDGTAYGQGLAREFEKTFEAGGGRVVGEAALPIGSGDPAALLHLAREAGAQGVYFGGLSGPAGELLKLMRASGMKAPFIAGDGARTPALFDAAGAAADGAYVTMVGAPLERLAGARAFLEAYQRRWGAPPQPFDHFAYEAAQVLLDALAESGAAKPGRAGLVAALRSIRHSGLLGVTAFDAKGDTLNKTITLARARFSDRSFPAVP